MADVNPIRQLIEVSGTYYLVKNNDGNELLEADKGDDILYLNEYSQRWVPLPKKEWNGTPVQRAQDFLNDNYGPPSPIWFIIAGFAALHGAAMGYFLSLDLAIMLLVAPTRGNFNERFPST